MFWRLSSAPALTNDWCLLVHESKMSVSSYVNFSSAECLSCVLRIYHTFLVLKVEFRTSSHQWLMLACTYMKAKCLCKCMFYMNFRTSALHLSYLLCSEGWVPHQLSPMTDVCLYIYTWKQIVCVILSFTRIFAFSEWLLCILRMYHTEGLVLHQLSPTTDVCLFIYESNF